VVELSSILFNLLQLPWSQGAKGGATATVLFMPNPDAAISLPNSSGLTLEGIKTCWNQLLDQLESRNRTLWLIFFDARLAAFDGSVLKLDFRDADKFSTSHDFSFVRDRTKLAILEEIALTIYMVPIKIEVLEFSK
jgi:hypothetical protein